MSWFTNENEFPRQLAAIAQYFGLDQISSTTRLGGHANSSSIKKDGSYHRKTLPQIEGKHHLSGKREPHLLKGATTRRR